MVSAKSSLRQGPPPKTVSGKSWLLFKRWLGAGAAMSCAEITLPIDTAKVRLQIQNNASAKGTGAPYKGLLDCMGRIVKEEGATKLYTGLKPAIGRQLVYGGLRLCLYDYVRDFTHEKIQGGGENPWLITKIVAALATGAFAMCVAQPTDVVKIRFQADSGRYRNLAHACKSIIQKDGIRGLWKGLGPNVARNATINAAELATYDQFKETICHYTPLHDGLVTQWLASLAAGLFAVVIGSPIDVVKTRIMNARPGPDGTLPYRGTVHAFVTMAKQEGIMSFYQGFGPNFARLGTWNIVMFMAHERIKSTFREPLNYEYAV